MGSPRENSITRILDNFQINSSLGMVKVFNGGNTELHKAIEAQCIKEFSSENWRFLQKINELNNESKPSQEKLVKLFEEFIPNYAPSQINLSDKNRANFFPYEEKKQPLSLSDFAGAAQEISKLMMVDTFNRMKTSASKAIESDNNENNKIALQLTSIELLKKINNFAAADLKELPTSIFGRNLFKSSQEIAKKMKEELTHLLTNSENLSAAEFEKAYNKILLNLGKLSQYANIITEKMGKISDENALKIFNQQFYKLNSIKATVKIDFMWDPDQIANAKKLGIANIVNSFTSNPLVENVNDISATEVQTRSRSVSLSRNSK